MENHSRKMNIIIEGLSEENGENRDSLLTKIKGVLKITGYRNPDKVSLANYHRFGMSRGDSPRPVIIKYHYWIDRGMLVRKKEAERDISYFIKQDFCQETLVIQKNLFPYQKEA